MKSFYYILFLTISLACCGAFANSVPLKDYASVTDPLFNSRKIMTTSQLSTTSRITTLDVIGIGMTVEKFRQSQTWQELRKHLAGSILPSDLSTYEADITFKQIASEQRAANVLEYGSSYFVEHWPIPSISVWPYCGDKEEPIKNSRFPGQTNYAFFYDRIDDLRMPAGMHYHRIASLGSFFRNEPEEVLERAFQFFDNNPEVPALLLLASDGDWTRGFVGDKTRQSFIESGPRLPGSMAETYVVLVLARRDRVDTYLRPFVATKAKSAKQGFKPSKFLPAPWNAEQLEQFDHLPTIAVLHRPVRVSYHKDKNGKPTFDSKQQIGLMSAQQKQAAFQAGLDAALKDLPGGKPARIFYDAGGPTNGGRIVPLSLAVHHALPDFDLFKPDEGYDISMRIGNTGASSPFAQWALATMAAFDKKDASLTVNLRQKDEAMITVVTPSADRRLHPMNNPIDFNLAPEDGGPAIPVAPPAPAKPAPVQPSHTSSIEEPAIEKKTEPAPIGTVFRSGEVCSQTGMWRCDPADHSGDTFHVYAGRTFPPVTLRFQPTALQKLQGERARDQIVDTTWTLLSYK